MILHLAPFGLSSILVLTSLCLAQSEPVTETPTEQQSAPVTPPPAPAPVPEQSSAGKQGEVTANDVYVRSGDSPNHYTICKLNAGNRVTIVSERGEWYEILPPPGTFSLVSGDFVDSADGRTGMVNGDNVRVRAGSLLNENKYTVQTSLKKGVTVNILGRNPDGFLQIEPPPGATVWINKAYVRPADGSAISSAAPVKTESTPSKPQTGAGTGALASPMSTEKSASTRSTPPPTMSSKWRKELEEIDTAAREETKKETAERSLSDVIARYKAVSEQTEDEYARQYATSRLAELGTMSDLAAAVDKVRQLNESAEVKRREFMEGRGLLPNPSEPVPKGAQVQGELRISALYPPGSAIVRYRLIDPSAEKDRTVAYVEIPEGSSIKIENFVGRYVGVIAYERRLHSASVDPVPIYVASELMLLEPPKTKTAQK